MNDKRTLCEFERGYRHGMLLGFLSGAAIALAGTAGYWVAAAPPAPPRAAAPAPLAQPAPALLVGTKGLETACMGYWFGDVSMNKAEVRRRVCGK